MRGSDLLFFLVGSLWGSVDTQLPSKGGGAEKEEEVGSSGIHSSQHNYQLDIGMFKKKEEEEEKKNERKRSCQTGSAGWREEEGISEGRGWTMEGA